MKKILLLSGVACLFSLEVSAQNLHPYISLKAKYSMMDNPVTIEANDGIYNYKLTTDADDNVFGGNIALGLDAVTTYGDWRTELEYTKNADAKKKIYGLDGKVESHAFFLNTYYDFKTNTPFMPYIGGGLGAAKVKASLDDGSLSDESFAWNLGCGLIYHFNSNVAFDLGYRYVNYGKFTDDTAEAGWIEHDKVESTAHEIIGGIRFTF